MDFIFNIGREGEGEREMRMPSPAWILRIFASWFVRAFFFKRNEMKCLPMMVGDVLRALMKICSKCKLRHSTGFGVRLLRYPAPNEFAHRSADPHPNAYGGSSYRSSCAHPSIYVCMYIYIFVSVVDVEWGRLKVEWTLLTLFNLLILWKMGPSVIITRNAEMESGGGHSTDRQSGPLLTWCLRFSTAVWPSFILPCKSEGWGYSWVDIKYAN